MADVLVVDNDPINMELSLEILHAWGFSAEGAQSGTEAAEKINKKMYDLILTEINLSGKNGFELRNTIKNKPEYKQVPVVALTAYAMKGDKERILEAGFEDYISKPIDITDFMNKMEAYARTS